jgi:hypothetical protein
MSEQVELKNEGVVSIIGDFAFPHSLDELISSRAESAIRRLLYCIKSKKPKKILLCPTPGVIMNCLPFILLNSKVTMVLPTQDYIKTFSEMDQDILSAALKKCEHIVVVSSDEETKPTNYLSMLKKTFEYMMEVSDWTLFAHCDEVSSETERLMSEIGYIEIPTLRINLTVPIIHALP